MPFAVATVALISAELLDVPAGLTARAGAATSMPPRAAPRPQVTTLPAAGPDEAAARYRLLPPDGPDSSTDLALYVGRRDHGAQFEVGALGGGRSDAPGLVHVGIGWDF